MTPDVMDAAVADDVAKLAQVKPDTKRAVVDDLRKMRDDIERLVPRAEWIWT